MSLVGQGLISSEFTMPDVRGMSELVFTDTEAFSVLSLVPELWYDASDTSTITSSSNLVSQWDDKSGNDRHLEQAIAANQPATGTTTINGKNVINFNASSTRALRFETGATTDDWRDIYMVVKHDAATFVRLEGFVNSYSSGGTNSGIGMFGNSGTDNLWSSGSFCNDNIYLNGVRFTSTPYTVLPAIQTQSILSFSDNAAVGVDGITIGNDRIQASSRAFEGSIAEVVVFTRQLNAEERGQLNEYFAEKWDITLS